MILISIECYNKSLKINPKNTLALINKGAALLKLYKYEESEYNKKLTLEHFPDEVRYQYDDYLKDAIKCFNKLLKINPKNTLALNNKGIALAELNRFEEAIDYYDDVIRIDPKNELTWLKKGEALGDSSRIPFQTNILIKSSRSPGRLHPASTRSRGNS